MAAGFSLASYPWTYRAKWTEQKQWSEQFLEGEHLDAAAEAALPAAERAALLNRRNAAGELPLVNYTTQYGLGCFEGLKAYPQADGGMKVFRPDQNGIRFENSMKGLLMPGYPATSFVAANLEVVRRNAATGFRPAWKEEWRKDNFISAEAVYLRPFTLAEGGLGLNQSYYPWVIIVATPVGSYFDPDANSKAVTTNMIRATSHGTGWIKCDANYVIPILAKKAAIAQGYMEAIFLDPKEQTYVEEGSSCNIFFLLKDGTLVTPAITDRVLDGVNRRSVKVLAADLGVKVEERPISIHEAMDKATECFVTGTAAGVSFIESVTHGGKTAVFNKGKMGELTTRLLVKLKGIQYGTEPDTHNWMVPV
jgi:branched-chain amino acid aminotransferase